MTTRTACLALLLAAGFAALPASAQVNRRGVDERGVTLHRDLDFTGVSQTFSRDVPDLRGTRIGNDHATSVSLSRGCAARLYRDTNYRGEFTELTRDLRDLRGTRVGDDAVSSLRVRCRGEDWGDGDRGVTLYRDLDYSGVSETFTGDVPDLRQTRFGDDHATSVSISRGCTARLYRDLDFTGEYSEIRDDVPDLRRSRVGDDQVTSLQVWRRGDGSGSSDHYGGGSAGYGQRGVTLHRDLAFKGVSETFTGDVPDLRRTRIGDDHATSVSLDRGCTARLYRDPNFQGAFTDVTRDIADLRGSRVGNDSVSSLEVRCHR